MKSINTMIRESEGFDIQKDIETWEKEIEYFLKSAFDTKDSPYAFPVYCLLDGFAERDEDDRKNVIEGLMNLLSKESANKYLPPVDEVFIENLADTYKDKNHSPFIDFCEKAWEFGISQIEKAIDVAVNRVEK